MTQFSFLNEKKKDSYVQFIIKVLGTRYCISRVEVIFFKRDRDQKSLFWDWRIDEQTDKSKPKVSPDKEIMKVCNQTNVQFHSKCGVN